MALEQTHLNTPPPQENGNLKIKGKKKKKIER